ncbi:AfsR/SARP family transcriptional regulator [Streptomyces sp. NBC_00343]|uniref:AfsR/SARP family transcriptional regulator n=1 Tax=Streptomyces sp. NBC_00343 TaxID=2975719 RepID=UPI002E2E4FF3|nr:BTAD domain-containing putative transcriptional regulator [Streptomyces sp. NBC_00343]
MDAGLRFAVLGPVRAWRGSDEIDLGPPQQRAVLAVLLLAEGSQVLSSGLVAAVWGTRTPRSAPGVLRTYVHRLRKALEPTGETAKSVLRSTGDGYQLRISPKELDLAAFRELIAQGDRARRAGDARGAAECLREGLTLWRGPALAGVPGEYARNQRQRLEELRLSAEEARITAELDLGAAVEVTAELTALVAEHPLDERFRELFMLALYRSGRQAAALATYHEARTYLAGELGVDPGPELRSMYQRVLRADDDLLAPPSPAEAESTPDRASAAAAVPVSAVPAQLPPSLPVFVGREAELAEVLGLPRGRTVVISAIAGTAGVGKTAFAVNWARKVADSFPDGQLYLNLRGFDPAGPPITPDHALRTLLESMGADGRGLPRDTDALAALYRTLLNGKRVLVLLDNARDAAQVRPLLPGAPGCLVIVTSRDRLSGLIAVDGAHTLQLDVLSVPEARALLARRLGPERIDAEPAAVEEIIARCARLPLALAVTAARAATRPTFPLSAIATELRDSLDAFHDGDTAADVRAVFSVSYHSLTPDAARLFRLLGLHPGPDLTLSAAAGLAALTLPNTRRLLAELVGANLLEEPLPGRYASHDLLRAYAAELAEEVVPPPEARAARHRMFDHYLHTAREALALTVQAQALISLSPPALGVCTEEFSGDIAQATAWFASEQAVLLAAVEQAAAHGYDVHAWQLAWAMAGHLHRSGLWREQEAVHHTAMRAVRRLGDRAAQAHVHRGLAWALGNLERHEEARVHAEHAVELFLESGDMEACADGYCTLSWVAEQQGDLVTSLDIAQRRLALIRTFDGPETHGQRHRRSLASALNAVGWFNTLLGQPEQALTHCGQALALQQGLGDDVNEAHTYDSIGLAHCRLGRYEQAVAAYREAVDGYRRGHVPSFVARALVSLGDTHLEAGQPEAARAAWAEGLAIMDQLGHAEAEPLRDRLNRVAASHSREGDGRPSPAGPAARHPASTAT